MSIKIIAFGPIADITGCKEFEVDRIYDTESLRMYLSKRYNELEKQQFVIAIGNKIIGSRQRLSDGASVALLPPFSGG